tara:strand:+ start:292 stop:441 length:150 start_codon:yes stop_codon:yes gene_type:complete
MKKLIQMVSVMAGILLILYIISWIVSGEASEEQKSKFKQRTHIQQEKIR